MAAVCEAGIEAPGTSIGPVRIAERLRPATAYVVSALLSCVIIACLLRDWSVGLTIPFHYKEDSLFAQVFVKSIFEHGWYLHNPNLGAPQEMDLRDFPMAESLHFAVIRLVCLVSPNYAAAFNLFFLLTFPLTALTAMFMFRRFGVAPIPAVLGSLLAAFLPHHFLRGLEHIFLAAYYVIPLSVTVMLWIYLDRVSLFRNGLFRNKAPSIPTDADREPVRTRRLRLCGSLAICLLQASAGIYYAFFACYLLLVAGAGGALERRRLAPLYTALLCIAVTTAGVVINFLPSLIYTHRYGHNTGVSGRQWYEAEMYGMKVAQLLLPIPGHRNDTAAKMRADYDLASVSSNENAIAALGGIASIGFLILVGRLLFRRRSVGGPQALDGLCALNIFAVLLGSMGSFGALFNFLVAPQIRCYNRISIYIGIFSLFAVILLLQRGSEWILAGRYLRRPWLAKLSMGATAGLLLFVALADQVPQAWIPRNARVTDRWKNDADFVARVEAAVPERAMIFQYPYMSFPEHWPIHKMLDYQHFRGYLHSSTLRWSYGAMRARQVDAWMDELARKPVDEQLQALAYAGFSGVYVDRSGFPDGGAEFESALLRLSGSTPLVSADQSMAFYNIADYVAQLKQSVPAADWAVREQANRYPLQVTWNKDFYYRETSETEDFRWCRRSGEIVLYNSAEHAKQVSLEFYFGTAPPNLKSTCRVESSLFEAETLSLVPPGNIFKKTFTVPPGQHKIRLTSDARRIEWGPTDPRDMVFSVNHAKVQETAAGPGVEATAGLPADRH